jgi:tRNA pseudouridine55 synthase
VSAPDVLRKGCLFLIDKPEGLTSHDVVERVRAATGVSRIGHSGTLDPMATGLLLLCAGGAARLQSFFTLMDKSYEGTIRLGLATTTYDREGERVGADRDCASVTPEAVERAAAAFRGEFLQAPPAYSAKKVGGRKFYEMARKGESVPSMPKKVRVTELSFGELQDGRLPFAIACSSGTYIRSIANDLGDTLGCGAHLESLRRTRIGAFSATDAVGLEAFESMSSEARLSTPHAVPLSRVPFPFPRVQLASLEAWKIRRGQAVPARGVEAREGDWVTLIGPTNDMLALGQINPIGDRGVALIKPRIVLAE